METDVSVGWGNAERLGRVVYSLISRSGQGGKALIVGAEGLMGVAGMEWWVYQVNTICRQLASHPKTYPRYAIDIGGPQGLPHRNRLQ